MESWAREAPHGEGLGCSLPVEFSWFSLPKLWVCQSETGFLQVYTVRTLLPSF